MARPEIPDTTVLIRVIREPKTWLAFQAAMTAGRIWLSSVVIAELYAGTRSREDGELIDRIAEAMARDQRLLTPDADDWARAGRLINRRIRLQGALRPRDHLADVLVVSSAAKLGGAVVTADVRHFEAWAQVARNAGLDVAVVPYSPQA